MCGRWDVCVYEMATLKHAFNAKDMNSLVYKILRGKVCLMVLSDRTYVGPGQCQSIGPA